MNQTFQTQLIGTLIIARALACAVLAVCVSTARPALGADRFVGTSGATTSSEDRRLGSELGEREAHRRLRAADELRRRGPGAGARRLREARRSEPDGQVRLRINQALASSSEPGVYADLVDSLRQDRDPLVREGAARQLGNYVQAPGVVAELIRSLERDSDPAVRRSSAYALSISKSPEAAEALERASTSPDTELRRQAASGLSRRGDKRSKRALKKMRRDPDARIRRLAGGRP